MNRPAGKARGFQGLAALAAAPSAAAMRRALLDRYPGFDPSGLRELAVLGAAEEGGRLARICAARGIEVRAVCDDDPARVGSRLAGHRVRPLAALEGLDREIPVVVASHRVLGAIERLRGMGFASVAPFALLQVLDRAAFPPHMFYHGWLEDLGRNRSRYGRLYEALADDASRRTLDAVIGFRLTLDPAVLRPVLDGDLYLPRALTTLKPDEVYVDAGAYDGDSVRLFVERTGGRFKRVLAFEPGAAAFERLAANCAGDPRIEPINKGLYSRSTTLGFDGAGQRGAALSETGTAVVPVVALDEALGGDPVTFIKMNIEGAELEALEGARRAIARWQPRLAISAYHRPGDLWQVPAKLRRLRPDCRLYLRQHDGGVIETVAYAV